MSEWIWFRSNQSIVSIFVLPLDDPRWSNYEGGYRLPYDASIPLRRLMAEGPNPVLWDELWGELHHQGDAGSASYAAVPWLLEFARRSPILDWNVFALVACIELERPAKRNPPLPAELQTTFFQAINGIPTLLGKHPDQAWDALMMQGAAACTALARGQRAFAHVYFELNLDAGLAWIREETGFEPGDDI